MAGKVREVPMDATERDFFVQSIYAPLVDGECYDPYKKS